ncbi:hypothetical protein GGQ73_003510 [Rhizobium skierniewicense]|uniref:Uncharacterized protein n=1 Tax=Rhizobium skierniewicense TaxID=984260 RepID=A0A7W6G367_9HYPH|nr:hypothetical protein [Rhizobium skierniewicense]
MDEAFEVDGCAFVAGGKSSEVLEPIEAAFDAVTMLLDEGIVRNECLTGTVGRDDRFCAHVFDRCPQGIAIVAGSAR